MDFNNFASKKALEFFSDLCKIPHGSGNEKEISDMIMAFAGKRGLHAKQDSAYNIYIKKKGTKGYENAPPVIIQNHLDMVCEKNDSVVFDFLKDPIKTRIEGDFLMANGTTLGADNCAGVGMAMALLDSEDIPHPPLEIVLTTNEETGMEGAESFDTAQLKGKYFINLDSEGEGKFCCGCAGGLRAAYELPVAYEPVPDGFLSYKISVFGLSGGHSGSDIHLERGNAIIIAARLLNKLKSVCGIRLSDFSGGAQTNAIPRESRFVISFNDEKLDEITKSVLQYDRELKHEFRVSDGNLQISIEKAPPVLKALSAVSADKVIASVMLCPSGVQAMSMDVAGLVESSNNVGVIKTAGDAFTMLNLIRSSVTTRKYMILDQIKVLAETLGAKITVSGNYAGWEYMAESKLRDICTSVYIDMFGKDPVIDIIHAGLECGLFSSKIKDLDAISLGFDILDAHTPDERLSLPSFERTWLFLLAVLEKIV